MNGTSINEFLISDDLYVKALEDQCAKWEKMYEEVAKERDQWKDRALQSEAKIARSNRKLRHV